jgi:hypothetical protein
MQKHLLGGVVIVIALAHFIWAKRIAEFNNRRPLFNNPFTVFNVRALGVFLLFMRLLALMT